MRNSHNIDYLILKELKNIPKHLLFYSIVDMVNGEYIYATPSLNSISAEEIALRLEKILILGSKKYVDSIPKPYVYNAQRVFLWYAQEFSKNIDNIKYRHLRIRNQISSTYNFMIRKLKISQLLRDNKFRQKANAALIVIAMVALFRLSAWGMSAITINGEKIADVNLPQIEMMDGDSSFEDILAMDENVVEEEKEYIEKEELQTQERMAATPTPTAIETSPPAILETSVSKTKADFEIDLEIIVSWVCETYGLTREEFDVVASVVVGEAKAYSGKADDYEDCYQDAYNVITTIFNRTISKKFIWTNENICDLDGRNIYHHVIAPGQFERYGNGSYKTFWQAYDSPQFEALIDFFISQERSHDYLYFKASNWDMGDTPYSQPVKGGNKYHGLMSPEDRLDYEPVVFNR